MSVPETLNDKLGRLLAKTNLDAITLKVEWYGSSFVNCTIIPRGLNSWAVNGFGETLEKSIDKALALRDKVDNFTKVFGRIERPLLSEQPYIGGYLRREYKSGPNKLVVEFKNVGGQFIINGISLKDSNDFYWEGTPWETPKYFSPVEDLWGYTGEGETLYMYDTIRGLSGCSGYAIVKDGKVIKTKTIAIS